MQYIDHRSRQGVHLPSRSYQGTAGVSSGIWSQKTYKLQGAERPSLLCLTSMPRHERQ